MATELLKLAVQIVSSHVLANKLSPAELQEEIRAVYRTLAELAGAGAEEAAKAPVGAKAGEEAGIKPAVPVEEALQDKYVVCLECGAKLKTLKAHLRRAHDLTPAAYAKRFGLDPKKVPLVCRDYSALRRKLAQEGGLGEARRARKA